MKRRSIPQGPAEKLLRGAMQFAVVAGIASSLGMPLESRAQEKVLNLYSARHYQTDEALYSDFTKQTGIKINRIEAGDEQLLQRLKAEATNSPADVLLLVDAARLWRAQIDGLFQPVELESIERTHSGTVCARTTARGTASPRVRASSFTTRTKVKPEDIDNYEELADPKNKGKVCTRSGISPLQPVADRLIIERLGEPKAEQWAKGMVSNMARPPRGGDTDQIKAVAAGECGVAIVNSYYWVRLMRSSDPKDKEVVSKVGFIWPNQATSGTHVNISGGGVAKNAPNKANAVAFLEYLASPSAQTYFANGNNEFPVTKGATLMNAEADFTRQVQAGAGLGGNDRQEPSCGAAHSRSRRLQVITVVPTLFELS